jgi:hypothetical protein
MDNMAKCCTDPFHVELDSVSIEATTEQPFWVEDVGWTGAAHLKPGHIVKKFVVPALMGHPFQIISELQQLFSGPVRLLPHLHRAAL